MKQFIKWGIKLVISGCIALAVLCLFCLIYSNVPVHYTNETGATEYYWEKNSFYSGATEGFGMGRTNNEGFINLKDHNEGDRIDILLMGSSQMEARNVMQDRGTAAVLNRMFDGEKYVYNIGTAGHTLMHSIKNLDSALTYYAPGEYVLLETFGANFSSEELTLLLNGEYPGIPSHNGGIAVLLQKIPYLRLFYQKYIKGLNFGNDIEKAEEQPESIDEKENVRLLNETMAKVADVAEKHGVIPVVVYENAIAVDENGECFKDIDVEAFERLRNACEMNGVIFLDATDYFMAGYRETYRMPMGYANTTPGVGHMNNYGHMLFAQCIYDAITEMEAE